MIKRVEGERGRKERRKEEEKKKQVHQEAM
jgi:hypothetical protein